MEERNSTTLYVRCNALTIVSAKKKIVHAKNNTFYSVCQKYFGRENSVET